MTKRELPKGIYLRGNKYVAQARVNKKQIQLGTFTNLEEAVEALDKAIGRALHGLETVVKPEKILKKARSYEVPTVEHPDDEMVVDHFQLYIIVKGNTLYPQWLRNTSLPSILTLAVAKKFLAKRDIIITSLEEFQKLYQKRLDLLLEPWLVNYKLIGKGSRKNTLQVQCKRCKTLSLVRVGDPVVECGCGSGETVVFFGRNPDGSISISIGPTRPTNVLGVIYVPTDGFANIKALGELETALQPAPEVEPEVLDKPRYDPLKELLQNEEEDNTDEEELDAYNKLLEDKLIDLDSDFDFEVPAEAKSVAKQLLEEDRAEKNAGASFDSIKKDMK